MANIKKWDAQDYEPVVAYLHNTVANGEVVLKLRDRKGVRKATIKDEVELAIRALQTSLGKAFPTSGLKVADSGHMSIKHLWDEKMVGEAFENWITEYLVEGGRAKLLNALRVREHRAEQVEAPVPNKVRKQDKQPVDRVDQLVKVLSKYTKQEIDLALSRMI